MRGVAPIFLGPAHSIIIKVAYHQEKSYHDILSKKMFDPYFEKKVKTKSSEM